MRKIFPLFLLFFALALPCWTQPASAQGPSFGEQLAEAALDSVRSDIRYDGSYVPLDYPWGDVPATQGVCADVLVRAYRALGIDLQKRVHEDMRENFSAYPSRRIWGLTGPDSNIDHRRVYNLETFFVRNGETLPVTQEAGDYSPGDLVSWMVPKAGGGLTPHIGIVSTERARNGTPLIIHHLSGSPRHENVLFVWQIRGHYRYAVADHDRD